MEITMGPSVDEQMPTELDIQATLRSILSNQQMLIANQKLIIDNQTVLAKDIYDVRKGVLEIFGQLPKSNDGGTAAVSHQISSDSNLLSSFEKIVDEKTLDDFEKKSRTHSIETI